MNKTKLILTLRNAGLNHKKWSQNALSLIEGVPLDKSQVPVNSTDCDFGQWYYSEGQSLRDLPGFNDIEKQHDKLHSKYREIFVLLFGEDAHKISFLDKLFGRAEKIEQEKKQEAMEKYQQLNIYSKKIMKQLTQLERIIDAMNEAQLDKYMGG